MANVGKFASKLTIYHTSLYPNLYSFIPSIMSLPEGWLKSWIMFLNKKLDFVFFIEITHQTAFYKITATEANGKLDFSTPCKQKYISATDWSFCQFHSIPFGQFQFHLKFINSNSKFSNSLFSDSFSLINFTMSRYSMYLLGIHTPSSFYSK